LAILSFWFGDYGQTEQLLDAGVRLGQEIDDKIGLALTLKELGKLQAAYGTYEQAIRHLRASIAITDEIGSHWESAATLDDLGFVSCLMGDYETAEDAIRRCLEASEARRHRYFIARCLGDLGFIEYYKEQYERAWQYLGQALDIWIALGHEPYCAWVLCQRGHVRQAMGREYFLNAAENYSQALQLSLKHQLAPFAMEIFAGAAKLLLEVGEKQRAIDLLTLSVAHSATSAETRNITLNYLADIDIDQTFDSRKTVGSEPAPEWRTAASELVVTLAESIYE
jgi:tetratricopeptide (TPR) repeat protein